MICIEYVYKTHKPLMVKMGPLTLGRVTNCFGDSVDGKGFIPNDCPSIPVRQKPPAIQDIIIKSNIIETGIKAIDFFTPYTEGSNRIFWWCGCG